MMKAELETEAETAEVRLLRAQGSQEATGELLAIDRSRSLPSTPLEPSPGPAGDAHLLTGAAVHLFQAGTHFRLYEKLGAHPPTVAEAPGVQFAVWAPNAETVSVIGDFNQWDPARHPLHSREDCGIWEGFEPDAKPGLLYNYCVVSRHQGNRVEKADPRQGFHPEWKSSIFNYGRHEVRSFLLSSTLFWLDKYHAGLPFRMVYAFHENFVLPLSQDEVVHRNGSLFGRMLGDEWQPCRHWHPCSS